MSDRRPREVCDAEGAKWFGSAAEIVITGYFELVLGDRRSSNLMHVVTEIDPKTGVMLARNGYNSEFGRARGVSGLQPDRSGR